MKPWGLLASGLALGVLISAATWYGLRARASYALPAVQGVGPGPREIQRLETRLDRLETLLSRLRQRGFERTGSEPPVDEPSPTPARHAETETAEQPTPEQVQGLAEADFAGRAAAGRERRRRADEYFQAEPRDPGWTRKVEAEVGRWFENERLAQHSVEEVDCRSTLCRIVVDVPPGGGGETLMMELSPQLSMFERVAMRDEIDEGGKSSVYMYAVKLGSELPF